MTPIKKKEPLSGFDEAKIAELDEPIAVTIHKMIGNKPSPVSIPVKPGEEIAGQGLTQNECRSLDAFIGSEYGGGDYVITATGSNGAQFKWNTYFPLDKHPDTSVSTVVSTRQNGRVQPSQPMMSPQASPQAYFGDSYGPPSYVAPPGWMAPSPYQPSQRQQQTPFWAYPPPVAPSSSALEDKLLAEREARLQLEARADRERQEAMHRAEMAGLKEELRRLAEAGPRRGEEDAAVVELRRQNEELRRRLDAEAERRAADERFGQLQRQIEAQNQQFQLLMTKLAERPSGPDPTMMLLVEAQKAQAEAHKEAAKAAAEAQKEAARINAEAQKDAARSALGPREMIDLMARLQPNSDQLAGAFSKVMELQQRAVENILQVQGPQTHPALEMAGRAAEGILGVAQQYIAMKESAVKEESHAKVVAAQVQAQAIQSRGQLAAVPPQPEGGPDDDDDEEEPEDPAAAAMEEELFGPALPHVERLRMGVATGKLLPGPAAQAVIQGIVQFQSSGKTVKAFELWQKGNIAELVGVLVPGALDSFKVQMAQELYNARQQAPR